MNNFSILAISSGWEIVDLIQMGGSFVFEMQVLLCNLCYLMKGGREKTWNSLMPLKIVTWTIGGKAINKLACFVWVKAV